MKTGGGLASEKLNIRFVLLERLSQFKQFISVFFNNTKFLHPAGDCTGVSF